MGEGVNGSYVAGTWVTPKPIWDPHLEGPTLTALATWPHTCIAPAA